MNSDTFDLAKTKKGEDDTFCRYLEHFPLALVKTVTTVLSGVV